MKTILLVGHRGTGKTTLTDVLTSESIETFDLDREIEKNEGLSPAEIIAKDEEDFRALEAETLDRLMTEETSRLRVISVGAGFLKFSTLSDVAIIWVYREGWEASAEKERARLRPEISFDEELAWMRALREPIWKKYAHVKYVIPSGRDFKRVKEKLQWTLQKIQKIPTSYFAKKSWIVASHYELERAMNDRELLGLCGVECRNDLLQNTPESDKVLASLRNIDSDWISAQELAPIFDIDIQFLDAVIKNESLAEITPRKIMLSCHPDRVDPIDLQRLIAAGRLIESTLPNWQEIAFKYAPKIETFDQLGFARALISPFRRAGMELTFLPQGKRFRFMRIVNLASNLTNYIPPRLNGCGPTTDFEAYDLQDWLPYLLVNKDTEFRALIGDPVESSQGAEWHGARYEEKNENIAYLKVPMHPSETVEGLAQLQSLGIHSLSVTSPLKKKFAMHGVKGTVDEYGTSIINYPDAKIRFANTLQWTQDGWIGTDTDVVGMRAALDEIEGAGFGPGTLAIFGKGDVTRALRAAIEETKWKLVYHTGAREGWLDKPHRVTLVVNASGKRAFEDACDCEVWLDLHYGNTTQHNKSVYYNGDTFYEAQAEAQIEFWDAFSGN